MATPTVEVSYLPNASEASVELFDHYRQHLQGIFDAYEEAGFSNTLSAPQLQELIQQPEAFLEREKQREALYGLTIKNYSGLLGKIKACQEQFKYFQARFDAAEVDVQIISAAIEADGDDEGALWGQELHESLNRLSN